MKKIVKSVEYMMKMAKSADKIVHIYAEIASSKTGESVAQ